MKNIFKYLLLPVVLVGFTACTNLDEELKDRFSENFDPSNPGVGIKNNVNKAQPNDGLQGAFSSLANYWHATNGGLFAVQELGTDEAVITQKQSSNGKYISITIKEVMINAEAIIAKYEEMQGIPGLMAF